MRAAHSPRIRIDTCKSDILIRLDCADFVLGVSRSTYFGYMDVDVAHAAFEAAKAEGYVEVLGM